MMNLYLGYGGALLLQVLPDGSNVALQSVDAGLQRESGTTMTGSDTALTAPELP